MLKTQTSHHSYKPRAMPNFGLQSLRRDNETLARTIGLAGVDRDVGLGVGRLCDDNGRGGDGRGGGSQLSSITIVPVGGGCKRCSVSWA